MNLSVCRLRFDASSNRQHLTMVGKVGRAFHSLTTLSK